MRSKIFVISFKSNVEHKSAALLHWILVNVLSTVKLHKGSKCWRFWGQSEDTELYLHLKLDFVLCCIGSLEEYGVSK